MDGLRIKWQDTLNKILICFKRKKNYERMKEEKGAHIRQVRRDKARPGIPKRSNRKRNEILRKTNMQKQRREKGESDLKSKRTSNESLHIINDVFPLLLRVKSWVNRIHHFLSRLLSNSPIIFWNCGGIRVGRYQTILHYDTVGFISPYIAHFILIYATGITTTTGFKIQKTEEKKFDFIV